MAHAEGLTVYVACFLRRSFPVRFERSLCACADAIKILDKADIAANDLRASVRREISIMKALSHTNIVNLREVLSSKSKLYIVMDLVRGGELYEMIERRGGLDEKLARMYFQQLVMGVDYCHRQGVCHRDLKPENLLVDENGQLKITDFGVSSMKADSNSSLLHSVVGTPHYCAPEILSMQDRDEGYDGMKVDAWSCGVILYVLLTGSIPFQADSMVELFEQISSGPVSFAEHPWMPSDARNLISNLLTKDPAVRYSLDDVKKDPWFRIGVEPAEANLRGPDPRSSSIPAPKHRRASKHQNPTHKDRIGQFRGRELVDLIKEALPGKPHRKIDDVVTKLEVIDIDCVEDMQCVAEAEGTHENFTAWLEEKSSLPSVTCMRLSRFFFE